MTASKLAKLRASRAAVIGADGFCLGGVTERKAVEGRSGLGLSVRSISSRTQHLRDRCTDAGDLLLASFRCPLGSKCCRRWLNHDLLGAALPVIRLRRL
jgi:hypothetical protein